MAEDKQGNVQQDNCYVKFCILLDEAKAYLETHKIPELFEQLAVWLIYCRPDNPKLFIIEHLKKLKEKQQGIPLLDEENLTTMFKMLDVQNRGYISTEQYSQAMFNIGVEDYNSNPIGGEINKISCDTFLRESKRALDQLNQGFFD